MNSNKIHKKDCLGFPSPLLGSENMRIEIIAQEERWLALNKPSLISVRQHPWEKEFSNLDACMNAQLKNGKPEFLGTNAQVFGSAYLLDYACSGVALFGKDKESIAQLRNAYGSEQMDFKYYFVATADESIPEEFEDQTPLLKHRYKSKMIPSTAKGKRSHTQFKRLSNNQGGWSLWEARSRYPRPHQIRLHASLSGLKVLGDSLYRGEDAPSYAAIGKWKKEEDRDKRIFRGLAMHLKSVQLEDQGGLEFHLEASFSKPFKAMLSYLNLKIAE